MEATRALTMLSLVSAGLGAAVLQQSIRRLTFEGVRYAEITDATLPSLSLAMIARRTAPHQMWVGMECIYKY
ncbi:hypothetical protein [Agrobacterium tumefaciens]|uniref:hypothetical protein n=1 Tax=Agrobacterium tumefaciens complex TaxID=1183400 RepID=UPI00080F8028|nr:hypothetical protein [Agrobacterium tumefaciens]OCJ55025.1 hypothetical protein A6U94_26975 [Agrobacterium tumefaciens]WIC88245.1 hypothetical protein A6U93_24095 [Agrobacterium tumefaciens]